MGFLDLFRQKERKPERPWLTMFTQTLPQCSAQEYMELWRWADREKGVPVLLKLDEQLEKTLGENRWQGGELPDPAEFLAPAVEKLLAGGEDGPRLGQQGDIGGGIERFMSFTFHEGEDILLAYVPAEEPWDIFRHLPIGGWGRCPDAKRLAAFCRELYRDFGAVPAVISGDTLELVPARRPEGEVAYALALKMCALCPDIVTQGMGSVWALADSLSKSDVWYFWWEYFWWE